MVERQWDNVIEVYEILVSTATDRGTTHYKYIGDQVGASARAVDGLYLVPIYEYCKANNFPNLTSIVVKKGTDEPGAGWASKRTLKSDRVEVYAFPWRDYASPTAEDFGED